MIRIELKWNRISKNNTMWHIQKYEFLFILSCVVTVNLSINYIILIKFSLSLSLSLYCSFVQIFVAAVEIHSYKFSFWNQGDQENGGSFRADLFLPPPRPPLNAHSICWSLLNPNVCLMSSTTFYSMTVSGTTPLRQLYQVLINQLLTRNFNSYCNKRD